jgi:hypothetical protein
MQLKGARALSAPTQSWKFITKVDKAYLYKFKVAKQLPTNFDDASVAISI